MKFGIATVSRNFLYQSSKIPKWLSAKPLW